MCCSVRKAFDRYFDLLIKVKYFVIVFWLIVLGLGAGFGLQFLGAVSIEVTPPKGTPSHDAKQAFGDLFPTKSEQQSYLLYFECSECSHIVNSVTYYRTQRLLDAAASWRGGYITGNLTYWTYPNTTQTGFMAAKQTLISRSNKSMIAVLDASPEHETADLKEFVTHMRSSISDLNVGGGEYVGMLGSNTILVDSVEESSTTVTKIDLIVLPMALAVLMYVVQSWRMIVIPLFNVATTLLSSFAMMYGLTKYTAKAPSFVPSVMEAMVIALSIDYSLFLLTRYRFEVLHNGRRGTKAVREAIFFAGEVVFMSGLTLVSCFLGMTGFPTQTVYMVGVGCSLCLTMALIINLTMTPALLLAFPSFFTTFQFLPFCTKKEGPGVVTSDDQNNDVGDVDYILADNDNDEGRVEDANNGMPRPGSGLSVNDKAPDGDGIGDDADDEDDDGFGMDYESEQRRRLDEKSNLQKSYWYLSTKACIKWPYVFLTILIPLALIAPATVHLFDFKYSIDSTQIAPRNSQSIECLNKLKANFPLGLMDPLYVIVDGRSQGDYPVKSTPFFEATSYLSSQLASKTACGSEGVMSIAFLHNTRISWENAEKLLDTDGFYPVYFNNSVNQPLNAALITLTTPFEPFGDEVKDFTKTVRDAFKDPNLNGSYDYHLVGAPIWMVDATDITFKLFPIIIAVTVAAIFVMISCLLVSAFIPLRYAFTLVFPLSFIFGLAVMVYQDGVMEWLSWSALRSTDGMYWLTPIITFPICTGLALDYDIFLMCRVAEYRMEGYTNKASILKAVHETGGIITAAGVIMAIAFGGMMFSQTDTVNQIGWILFSSVLFDTFVVRTVLVPAVLMLAGPVNWWPRKVPKEGLKDEFGAPAANAGAMEARPDYESWDNDDHKESLRNLSAGASQKSPGEINGDGTGWNSL